ncbi:hypothetical protein DEDE109153_08350 [Deinococcus deserti]
MSRVPRKELSEEKRNPEARDCRTSLKLSLTYFLAVTHVLVSLALAGGVGVLTHKSLPPFTQRWELYGGVSSYQLYLERGTVDGRFRWCITEQTRFHCVPYESTFLGFTPRLQYLADERLAINGLVNGQYHTIILNRDLRVVEIRPLGTVIGKATFSYKRGQRGVTRHEKGKRHEVLIKSLDGMPHDNVMAVLPFRDAPAVITGGGWVHTAKQAVRLTDEVITDVEPDQDGFVMASRTKLFLHRGALMRKAVRSVSTPGLQSFCVAQDYVVYATPTALMAVHKSSLTVQKIRDGKVRSLACNPTLSRFVANFVHGAVQFDLSSP